MNAGIFRPTNEAPSPVDNIIVEDVIDDDDVEIGTGEGDVEVQECKVEKTDPEEPKTEQDRISAGPDGGSFFNEKGQRRSARVKRYQDGRIHLQYRGHPYTLSQLGSQKPIISYDTGQTTPISYEEGVANINLSGDSQPQPVLSDEETTLHVLGVAMAQQLSLNTGLQKFGDRGEKAVTKELTQLHEKIAYVPVDPEELSVEQKNHAMRSLCLLTEK